MRGPLGCLVRAVAALAARVACNGPQQRLRHTTKCAAYRAVASTLPKGAARWPMQRDRGQCFIQVEAATIHRMRAVRRPGESYSEVILKLVELRPKISCASGPAGQFRELEMGPAQTG